MDHNLIFLHLPKNGGTTFHSILNRIYFKEEKFTIKSVTNKKTNEEDFISLPDEERLKIKLVKGHTLFGLHRYMPENTKYITFLRKPEDRIPSFYYYVLRKPNNKLYDRVTQENLSLYDFITQVESIDLNNCQVRWISGIDDKEDLMLEKALENIEKHFSFVGLTEQYNESLILLKRKYGWPMPYYEVKNKTKNRPILKAMDSKTLEAIKHFNSADIKLYGFIEEKLKTQMDSEPNMVLDLMKLNLLNQIYSHGFTRTIAGKIKRNLI